MFSSFGAFATTGPPSLFNTQTYNPAYVGSWESIGFVLLNRNQWLGVEGNPKTQTFSFQSPVGKKNTALGLSVVYDRIGKEKKLGLFGDYSYKLKLNENTNLRLGLKGGFTNYSNDLTSYQLKDPNDPVLGEPLENIFMPNFGVGVYMYSDKYYVGLASPRLIQNDFDKKNKEFTATGEFRHFFMETGVVFNLNDWLKFKPTALVKTAFDSPVHLDVSTNFLIRDILWLGTIYRTSQAWGAIAQVLVDKRLRVGYAIDFTLSDLNRFHDGIHEIMLTYEIRSLKKKLTSPRYF